MEQHICDYGCGKPAVHQFKNGKWCCSKKYQQCNSYREKTGNIHRGKQVSLITRKKISEVQTGRKLSKESIEKRTKKILGRKNTPETLEKMRQSALGKIFTTDHLKNMSIAQSKRSLSTYVKSIESMRLANIGKKCSDEKREKLRKANKGKRPSDSCFIASMKAHLRENLSPDRIEQMRKVGLIQIRNMLKNSKNSKAEIKLTEIVKELYPNSCRQHRILNYFVDIAIPEYNIVIEYDGYPHFYELGKKKEFNEDYRRKKKAEDDYRQKRIEDEGWTFLRYTMFQKFPTQQQVKEDIENVINYLKEAQNDTTKTCCEVN